MEIPPKLAAAILAVVVLIAGFLLYRGVSGSSSQSEEQDIQTMHQKMMKFPAKQPGAPQPVPTTSQPTTR
jgi:hypothetical protein